MTARLSPTELRRLRMSAQRLLPREDRPSTSVAALTAAILGVQAQDALSARLALWARSTDLSLETVDEALFKARDPIRTWCMRGTLHLLAREDLSWLIPRLGATFIRQTQSRYRKLGLDDDLCRPAIEHLERVLDSEGAQTRDALRASLASAGFPSEGQATYHLLRRAALMGRIGYGPDGDGDQRFVRLDFSLASETEPGRMARRYLEAYGPASAADLAVWSGCSKRDAKAEFLALGDAIQPAQCEGEALFMLPQQNPKGVGDTLAVHLVPSFDPWFLGYKDRRLTLPERFAKRVHPGGGVLRPALLVNGLAAGIWRKKARKKGLEVTVEPFEPLSEAVKAAIDVEIADLGRFLGCGATWVLAKA